MTKLHDLTEHKLLSLLIDGYEATLLWGIVQEERLRQSANAQQRRLIRKDGERNESRKYLSEYEEGLIEDLERLENLENMLFDLIPSADDVLTDVLPSDIKPPRRQSNAQ